MRYGGGGGDGEGGGGDGLGYVPATSVLRPSKSTNGLCIHIVMLRIIYISEPGTALYPLWLGSGTPVHCNSLSGEIKR